VGAAGSGSSCVLPLSAWNGKFLEVGSGGWGRREVSVFFLRGPASQGLRLHCLGIWVIAERAHRDYGALNNPQAQIDFAYRATHVTAVGRGKAICRGILWTPRPRRP